ncbi:MAG: ribonuclease HIII [Ignavibacteriales bacterium]|nr:ribonuclease HIII [Ignavibacteriales bacterium]
MENSALKKIQDYYKSLSKNDFSCSHITKKQYHFEFTAQKSNYNFKVLVYFGKKGVKTVIQGNNELKEYHEIDSIISGKLILPYNDEDIFYDEYIGTDETGKGDYFGPLVICGFYLNNNSQPFLQNIGVRDSKELTDSQIEIIASKIRKEFPNNYSIVEIRPEKYNQLYESFGNLNKLLDWGHSKVIENLLEKYPTKNVIIDKFSKTKISISQKLNYNNINFIQLTKAERYIGVAAASILARSTMNRWFSKMKLEGFNLHKGASAEVENDAKMIVQNLGGDNLYKFVKQHFKTTKKIFEN